MLDWLKNINKEFPDFWKKYLSKFDTKSNRYVAISIESSGLNPNKDFIISFGAIGIINDTIYIGDSFEISILKNDKLIDNEINNDELIEIGQLKLAEQVAIEKFINYIENATLVGHRINFDVELINTALEKLACGRLKNEAIDIEVMHKKLYDINDKNFSLQELSNLYTINEAEHISSADDAYTIALLFLKLKSKLGLK
jgi:DNA polymerase-3 subunit epsilon